MPAGAPLMKATMTILENDADYMARLVKTRRVWAGEMMVPVAPVSSLQIDGESEIGRQVRKMVSFDKDDLGPDGDFENERNGFQMDETVFEGGSFECLLDYPMDRPAHLQIEDVPDARITPRLILDMIKSAYTEIYRLEKGEDRFPPSVEGKSGVIVLNRPQTNGMFGIWGHDIQNLSVDGIEIGDAGDGHALLRVTMGS